LPEPRNDKEFNERLYKSAPRLGSDIVVEEFFTSAEGNSVSASRSEIIRKEDDQGPIAQIQILPK